MGEMESRDRPHYEDRESLGVTRRLHRTMPWLNAFFCQAQISAILQQNRRLINKVTAACD